MKLATLATGCFWCTEAVYAAQKGVRNVRPGYTGGSKTKPTYEEVCSGSTGHAECIQFEYDESQVSYDDLLDLFFRCHDPTTPNRQGNDVGTQYRSGIFYHDEAQREASHRAISRNQPHFRDRIVTEVTQFSTFWPAEQYHHNYYSMNGDKNPYCRMVIRPKLVKLGVEK